MEYQIGQFSKITELSVKTLRHYDDIGLLKPVRIDALSSYRYYSSEQLERVLIIGRLKYYEFSLSEITEMVASAEDDADILSHLHKRAQVIQARAKKYAALSAEIGTLIELQQEEIMESSVEIVVKEVPAMQVISLRYKGKYSDIGQYFKKLYRAAGMQVGGKPFALYYDEGYEEVADIEACIPVKKHIEKEGIECRELPKVIVHSYVHVGPYEALSESYKKLFDYTQKREMQLQAPSREIYVKGPGMIFKGNPQKYRTEIQMVENGGA
jgi:DNA-binding transcriptional MerR regulator